MPRHGSREQTAARKARVIELAAKGLAPAVIAERVGMTSWRVNVVLREAKAQPA
jgi:hypothetical protein